jgi:RNA 3'-terminal phosphate cyclase (ATP)
MLTLDGSMGEGGGQILRSALALSMCLQRPFRIANIRAARKRPGLRRQHLIAVQAAAEICGADVEGAVLGSLDLSFIPGEISAGAYHFDIGSAGSTNLVLQTVLPALLTASGTSRLSLRGGTHNPQAPSFDFLQASFLPLIDRMGPRITAKLERPGFYPAGGGLVRVKIDPVDRLSPIELHERGEVLEIKVIAMLAHLPQHIALRELEVIGNGLDISEEILTVHRVDAARGPGNAVSVFISSRQLTEVFTGFGQRGVRAETVATRVVEEAHRYLAAGVPVGVHLADQLLLPLALSGGGSLLTLGPSLHTNTNIEVIKRFMEIRILREKVFEDAWCITLTA